MCGQPHRRCGPLYEVDHVGVEATARNERLHGVPCNAFGVRGRWSRTRRIAFRRRRAVPHRCCADQCHYDLGADHIDQVRADIESSDGCDLRCPEAVCQLAGQRPSSSGGSTSIRSPAVRNRGGPGVVRLTSSKRDLLPRNPLDARHDTDLKVLWQHPARAARCGVPRIGEALVRDMATARRNRCVSVRHPGEDQRRRLCQSPPRSLSEAKSPHRTRS